ncbi:MAG: hypothetical protein G01um101470_514 [Parcubacteria group bacterium Gr01-1014_70]|nr:MAG: hypothetical protein G01um101470_514 [Parcubacteria group bacterium Gr01-1014_70]
MKGGCHCGAIRFKVTGEPSWVGACHCVDCRKISGSPYVVFAGYKTKNVEMLQGTPKEYASSEKVRRSFCEVCSSPFAYTYVSLSSKRYPSSESGTFFIPVGVFDDPSGLAPKKHIWTAQKLPWVHIE